MRMFLLKQIAQLTKTTVENVTMSALKRSAYASSIIVAAAVMAPLHAGEKLSDAELDTKFIEVQIRQICTLDDSKKNEDKLNDTKSAKYNCRTDDLFVKTINRDTDAESKVKQLGENSNQPEDSNNSSALLAGIFQNIRSLGGGDLLGVPAGVANSGNPVVFGSERYSYAWAGNLNQIFQISPTSTGYWNSIYDTSSLGYGFRAEAHFPYGPPSPSTVQFPNLNGRN